MPFNINSFKTNIQTYGYLPSNKYELFITPPTILFNKNINDSGTDTSISDITKLLTFRCEELVLPNISLINIDYQKYGVGTTQKFPIAAAFNEMTVAILSDGYGSIWQFWHNWIKSIYDFTSVDNSATGQANKLPSYSAEYKDNYSTTMQIVVYDHYGNAIQNINLYDAYPTNLVTPGLSWNNQNELMKLQVNITFKEYTLIGSNINNNTTNNSTISIQSDNKIIIQ